MQRSFAVKVAKEQKGRRRSRRVRTAHQNSPIFTREMSVLNFSIKTLPLKMATGAASLAAAPPSEVIPCTSVATDSNTTVTLRPRHRNTEHQSPAAPQTFLNPHISPHIMADTTEAGGASAESADKPQISFKIKAAGDKIHEVTISEEATVLDLKNKIATEEFENVPADRQRLIYSGRVMKNEDKLSVYKVKQGNTVHLVKSAAGAAARQPAPPPGPAQPVIPPNMATGTNNDLLSGLTGARFAGIANLPSASLFGADGGVSLLVSPSQM
jgi:hypothetical protein